MSEPTPASAREVFAALPHLLTDPYIPEVHGDLDDPEPLSPARLAEIAARAKATTPGPWTTMQIDAVTTAVWAGGQTARTSVRVGHVHPAHAEFIAAARADVPVLLAEVARLRVARREVLALCDRAERGATRWEHPLPVPEWVAQVRAAATGAADAPPDADPIQLRWGLDDVMWGDDDTVTLLLSGPDLAPYVLELDEERAAALRNALAGPAGDEDAPSTQQCGYDDYHDAHEWADQPHRWCPGRSTQADTGPTPGEALRDAADEIVADCPDHGSDDRDTGYMACHCDAADYLRRLADDADAGPTPGEALRDAATRIERRARQLDASYLAAAQVVSVLRGLADEADAEGGGDRG